MPTQAKANKRRHHTRLAITTAPRMAPTVHGDGVVVW